jgi:DNA-binding winged helix-turn-helix (wHTH) protein/Tfp pilus assembly protein PilF
VFPLGLSTQSPEIVRFGTFEADFRSGELRRGGVRIKIQDLPFRALKLLLDHPNQIVTRDDFRQALWPEDVFVEFDRAISSAVKRLRDALKDSADNPVFIETIERRGYRWIGPIQWVESGAEELRNAESAKERSAKQRSSEERSPEETSSEKQPTLAAGALPPQRAPWRKIVFVLPVLALVFAAWIFRPIHRAAKANERSSVATAANQRQPANREAEDLYLKGRFYWSKRTPESLNLALEAFQQAIAHDPNYSDAYVGLADSYNLLREFSAIPGNEAYFKAFAAAKKAVELDQQSSEAHASLGFVTFWGMWDAADAEKEFRRAIELDPNNAKAHHWYATFLHGVGRHEEALTEIDVARKLAPDSSSILADKGALLWSAGRHEAAMQLLKQLEAAEPASVSAHRYLSYAYFETGDYPNYIAELRADALLIHDAAQASVAEAAAKGFAKGGERGLLEAQLAEQKKLYEQGELSPYLVAQTEARLSNARESVKYLTICLQSHDERILELSSDPDFASLHGDPAVQQLLAKIGLPPIN